MDFEDRLTIATPEGVDVQLTLAGLGSRVGAAVIDRLIQFGTVIGLYLALIFPFMTPGGMSGALGIALFLVLYFLVEFGYHAVFLTLWSGRSPGKRAFGLRVLRTDGLPIRFREAAVRSLLLLVDGPVASYAVGSLAILLSRRNQRIGDMVAGTVVVRERSGGRRDGLKITASTMSAPVDDLYAWDLSGVTDSDLSTLRRFLERRQTLTSEARARLASQLADRVRARVVAPGPAMPDEDFIEAVVAVKSARS